MYTEPAEDKRPIVRLRDNREKHVGVITTGNLEYSRLSNRPNYSSEFLPSAVQVLKDFTHFLLFDTKNNTKYTNKTKMAWTGSENEEQ